MQRSFLAFAAAAVACSIVTASAPVATQADNGPAEVVVGAVLPLTGEESRVGTYFKAAYELATKEINDRGGLQLRQYGRKIPVKLVIYDDKTDPATSRNLYERLAVQDHVDAMLGGYSTDLVQAQTVVPNQHGIPYVGGGGAASAIYKRGFKTIFSLLASIENLAYTECDFIEEMQAQKKLPKPLKMAVVYENTSHGRDFANGLTQRAKQKPQNFQIVMSEAFDLHGKDFTPLLQKVKAANANAFMSDAHLDDYITMQRQYAQAGLHHAYITYGARGPEKSGARRAGQERRLHRRRRVVEPDDPERRGQSVRRQVGQGVPEAQRGVVLGAAVRDRAHALHRDDGDGLGRQGEGRRDAAPHRHPRHRAAGRPHPLPGRRADRSAVRRDREPARRQDRDRLPARREDGRSGAAGPGIVAVWTPSRR